MEEKLLEFIRNEFLDDQDIDISVDTKLVSSGIVDSFSLVSLQTFIEREFGKLIPAPRMTVDRFDTIRQIVAVINQQ